MEKREGEIDSCVSSAGADDRLHSISYVWGASSFTGAAAIIATIGYAMALQIHLSHTFVLAPAQAAPDAAAKKAF